MKNKNIGVVIPIYKDYFDEMEFFSIKHSLQTLKNFRVSFLCPDNLNLNFYNVNFPEADFVSLDKKYFDSVQSYNHLCYLPDLYQKFTSFDFILLLQPDAIVIKDELSVWASKGYDFIGGPETRLMVDDLKNFSPFSILGEHVVGLYGMNGGLSLRNPKAFLDVQDEYENIISIWKGRLDMLYHGEDYFYSLISRVSKKFKTPNEVVASEFALTNKFYQWVKFNRGILPMGFHKWYQFSSDKKFVLDAIRQTNTSPPQV